jgi:hypothetical protein
MCPTMPIIVVVAVEVVIVSHCHVVRKGWSLPPPAPPYLVITTIALFVAIALRSPATLVAITLPLPPSPSLLPATLIVITIARVALTLALFVARQPCHHHHPLCRCLCHCHHPCHHCLPLILVTIPLAAITIALFVARHPCH